MTRMFLISAAFYLASATPKLADALLMPSPSPSVQDPFAPVNNRAARRRDAKFARAA